MFKFLNKFFDLNRKEIIRLQTRVDTVNAVGDKFSKLKKPEDFKAYTAQLKKRLADGQTLDDILPEAFALVREASQQAIGLRPYDVQLMAAIAFHEGKVAEQKTGEGKTLSAIPAMYLNALTGNGTHLVTVNDYLARRDAGWNGPTFHLLGLSVGIIMHEKSFMYDPGIWIPPTVMTAWPTCVPFPAAKRMLRTLRTVPTMNSVSITSATTWSGIWQKCPSADTILPLSTKSTLFSSTKPVRR